MAIDSNLRRGLNIGGWLSQSNLSIEHFNRFVRLQDLRQIAAWGFDHIRLPIDYHVLVRNHMQFSDSAFELIDLVLQMCVTTQLRCVIDLHIAPGHSFQTAMSNKLWDDIDLQSSTIEIWRTLATNCRSYPSSMLFFDVLNEPTASNPKRWFDLAMCLTDAIRAIDLSRILILESHKKAVPLASNEVIPTGDNRTIYSFHFYEPLVFTHQHAWWSPFVKNYDLTVTYPGKPPPPDGDIPEPIAYEMQTEWDSHRLEDCLRPVLEFRDRCGVTIYCGEFGVYLTAPSVARLHWLTDILHLFKKHEIGWAYWTYKNMGFGLICDEGDFARLPEYQNNLHVNQELLYLLTE